MESAAAARPAPPRGPAIAVARVSKWFPTADGQSLHALQDIDLEIPERAVVAILGASGCGKSTLLNIISGLLNPDEGRIAINGVPSEAFTQWRSVSYIFQEDRLLPWRTAGVIDAVLPPHSNAGTMFSRVGNLLPIIFGLLLIAGGIVLGRRRR